MNKGVKADEEITWLKVTRYIFTYLSNNLVKEQKKEIRYALKIEDCSLRVECVILLNEFESEFISSHQYINEPDISFNHNGQLKWRIFCH